MGFECKIYVLFTILFYKSYMQILPGSDYELYMKIVSFIYQVNNKT